MKKIIYTTLLGLALSLGLYSYASGEPSPTGLWRTYDLQHRPRSIVKMYIVNGKLLGIIADVLPPQTANSVCSTCKGKWHNKKLIGLPIIWGLKKENNKWVNGKVLNIDNGKVYSCFLRVSNDNSTLYFSPYVGLPIFGRTINWVRVS